MTPSLHLFLILVLTLFKAAKHLTHKTWIYGNVQIYLQTK